MASETAIGKLLYQFLDRQMRVVFEQGKVFSLFFSFFYLLFGEFRGDKPWFSSSSNPWADEEGKTVNGQGLFLAGGPCP